MANESKSQSRQILPLPTTEECGRTVAQDKTLPDWTFYVSEAVEPPLTRGHSVTKPFPVLGLSSNNLLEPK